MQVLRSLSSASSLQISSAYTSFTCRTLSIGSSHRDSYDYIHILKHCKTIECIKVVHAQIITGGYGQNPFVAMKLMRKCVDCRASGMGHARKVFGNLFERDVFLWNVLIQGYVHSGPYVECVNIYGAMRRAGVSPNQYTYPYVIKACGALKDMKRGQIIHGHVLKSGFEFDLFVGNALVAFYTKTGDVETSRRLFDEMPQRDLVSWNSMISAYATNEFFREALLLFRALLQVESVYPPDGATFVAVLPACAQATAIKDGMWIHSYIIKSGMEVDAAVGSGLISMYGSCGRLNTAKNVFDRLSDKNVVVWTAMIRCYGFDGEADKALELFSQMVEIGVCPDEVTFLCLLSICSHAGMVLQGREIYERMEGFGVKRNSRHYACMVDLLGRSGLLDEAVGFMRTMPVEAGKDAYGALLGACRIYNRLELAEEVSKKLFILDSDNAGRYVTLAKMYEDVGKLEDAARVRKALKENNIRKPLGCSSVELDGVLQTFGVEDKSHPLEEQIFDTLEKLDRAVQAHMFDNYNLSFPC